MAAVPIAFTPWRSIREGSVAVADHRLAYDDARQAPCTGCATSACCTQLPLHTFRVESMLELSYAGYLLNFDHIRLGIASDGTWSAYYAHPCRLLDRETMLCSVHDTPAQPQICKQYNPYGCWYRRAITAEGTTQFMLLDRARFELVKAALEFDEHRNVVGMPSFDDLRTLLVDVTDEPSAVPEPPLPDAAYDAWRSTVRGQTERTSAYGPMPDEPQLYSFGELQSPCEGCSAPCCETIDFPQSTPTNASSLDYFRFALGFPGIELFVNDERWWLIVKSRCRHLQGGRCSVYGTADRPIQCSQYDEWKCTYRLSYGLARPATGLRIRYEHFDALAETITFDRYGDIVAIAPLVDMRAHVESRWATAMASDPGAGPSSQPGEAIPEAG